MTRTVVTDGWVIAATGLPYFASNETMSDSDMKFKKHVREDGGNQDCAEEEEPSTRCLGTYLTYLPTLGTLGIKKAAVLYLANLMAT